MDYRKFLNQFLNELEALLKDWRGVEKTLDILERDPEMEILDAHKSPTAADTTHKEP